MVRTAKQHIQNYPKKRRRRTILKKRQRGGIFPILALPFLLKNNDTPKRERWCFSRNRTSTWKTTRGWQKNKNRQKTRKKFAKQFVKEFKGTLNTAREVYLIGKKKIKQKIKQKFQKGGLAIPYGHRWPNKRPSYHDTIFMN